MKNISLLLISVVITSSVFAGSPAQELKKDLVSGCVSRGLERGGNPDAVYVFCSCTWDVLSHSLTVAEYVQMEALASSKGNPTTLPFWADLQPKLQVCKEKEASAVKP